MLLVVLDDSLSLLRTDASLGVYIVHICTVAAVETGSHHSTHIHIHIHSHLCLGALDWANGRRALACLKLRHHQSLCLLRSVLARSLDHSLQLCFLSGKNEEGGRKKRGKGMEKAMKVNLCVTGPCPGPEYISPRLLQLQESQGLAPGSGKLYQLLSVCIDSYDS